MDGHDNDNSNTNDNVNDSTSGGIFSTPDLTVDPSRLTSPSQNGNQNRIASAFANTDAGKQAQQLDAAMETSTQPLTEDLVIQNEPKQKSKLPLILAVLAVLVAIGVGGWVLIRSLSGDNIASLSPAEAFEEYRTYMIKGNEYTDIADSSDWLLYQLRNSSLSPAEMENYTNETSNRYNTFLASASNELKNDTELNLDRYGRLLELFEKSGSLRALRQNVLTKFTDGGAESAYNYITDITPVQPEDEEYRTMALTSELIGEYLNNELTLIEIYQNWGCIESGEISMSCVDDHMNTAYQEVITDQSSEYQAIINYTTALQTIFTSMTETISNQLGSAQ